MTKDEALKLALEALTNAYWPTESDLMPAHNIKECADAITAIKEALAEPEHGWTPERIAGMVRLKEAQDKKLAQPEQEPVGEIVDAIEGAFKCSFTKMLPVGTKLYTTPPQRTWVGLTPACPQGLTQYECEVEGVDLVCFLEYTPDEEGSRDSRGLLDEPGTYENLELVNAYVKGTDVDIGHLLLQYLVDHITTTALEDLKNDDL